MGADSIEEQPRVHPGDAARTRLEETVAELEREKRVVEALYRVGQAVAREVDLHEIVQVVTDETTAITGAQFGAFFYNVVRPDGESLSLYTISGVPREHFAGFPMPRATDIFRPTFEGTEIVRLDDVTTDPRFGRSAPYHGMPPGHLPVRSYLAVPVFTADGEVVGGLVFGHEGVGVFGPDDEEIAEGIATQAGLAIQGARRLDAERHARGIAEARANAALSLEYVEDGVFMVNADGVVQLWNPAAAKITGLAAADVVGRTIGEAVPGWEAIALDVPVAAPDDTSRPRTLPLDAAGREVWLSLYGVGFPEGTVYAFRDVTGERRLEQLRSDMIATVSHELRTPVAAVYGAAQTLRRTDLPPGTTARLLDILGGEAERLTGLVEEILLASQIDSGTAHVSREPVEPLETVRAAAASAGAGGHGPTVELELPASAPPVIGDRDRIVQVLANLLENVAKYGGGGAAVRLRVLEHALRFEIADRGPGIPRGEQERIFEKFYRLDPQMLSGVRGTGLGLYIARELVLGMGGRMGVESPPAAGATFWFELPRG